jgi:hypothetical protein
MTIPLASTKPKPGTRSTPPRGHRHRTGRSESQKAIICQFTSDEYSQPTISIHQPHKPSPPSRHLRCRPPPAFQPNPNKHVRRSSCSSDLRSSRLSVTRLRVERGKTLRTLTGGSSPGTTDGAFRTHRNCFHTVHYTTKQHSYAIKCRCI